MSLRIVELLFRRKFLLITPIILGAVLGGLWLQSSKTKTYSSQATVWVDQPVNFGDDYNVTDFSPYQTLAQNEANSMRELLATKSFRDGVLQKVDGFENPTDAESTDVLRHTIITPFGAHLVYVAYSSPNPDRTPLVTKTIIDEFGRRYTDRIRAKANQLVDYYNNEVGVAQSALESSSQALQSAIAGRPALASVSTQSQTAAIAANPDFGRAVGAQSSAKDNYDRALDRYTAAQITATSVDTTAGYFSVQDQPQTPAKLMAVKMKKALIKPVTGLFLGGLVSVALFLLWWRLDRKVRVPSDLAFVGRNIPVVSLAPVRKPRRRRRWPENFVYLAAAINSDLRS